jgi:hypothetical protein
MATKVRTDQTVKAVDDILNELKSPGTARGATSLNAEGSQSRPRRGHLEQALNRIPDLMEPRRGSIATNEATPETRKRHRTIQ